MEVPEAVVRAEPTPMLDPLKERGFQVEFHNHARAILQVDFPGVIGEIQDVLMELAIPVESLVRGAVVNTTLLNGYAARFTRSSGASNFQIDAARSRAQEVSTELRPEVVDPLHPSPRRRRR